MIVYQDEWTTLYHGDVRNVLPNLDSVDLIVTDPPYKKISGGKGDFSSPSGILAKNDGKIFKYNDIEIDEYTSLFFKCLKENAHLYVMYDDYHLEKALREFRESKFKLHKVISWVKNTKTPNRWYMNQVEWILFFRKGRAFPINNKGDSNVFFDQVVKVKNRIHETEKPVSLIEKMILNSSQEDETVLDPFCGSGSSLVAAKKHKRKSIGVEIDESKIELIIKRLSETEVEKQVKIMSMI